MHALGRRAADGGGLQHAFHSPCTPPRPHADSSGRPAAVPLGGRRRHCHRHCRYGRGAAHVAVDWGPAPPVARCGSQSRESAPLAAPARTPPAPPMSHIRGSSAGFSDAKGAQKTRFQHFNWQRRGAAVFGVNQRMAHGARRGLRGRGGGGQPSAACVRVSSGADGPDGLRTWTVTCRASGAVAPSPLLRGPVPRGSGGGREARSSLEGAWRSKDGRRCIDSAAREDGSVARTMLH